MEVLKNKKYLGIAGIGILFLSVFFPFLKASAFGYSADSDALIKIWPGWVLLLMSVACAMILFRKELEDKIPQIYKTNFGAQVAKWGEKGILIPTGIAAADLIMVAAFKDKFFNIPSYIDMSKYIKYNTGFWFALVGIALLAVHAFIYKGEETAPTHDFNAGQPAAWQPQQPMNQGYAQPMQQDQNMMNQGYQQPMMNQNFQPQQDMNQGFQPQQPDMNQTMGQDQNQFPNNNNQF